MKDIYHIKKAYDTSYVPAISLDWLLDKFREYILQDSIAAAYVGKKEYRVQRKTVGSHTEETASACADFPKFIKEKTGVIVSIDGNDVVFSGWAE